MSSSTSLVNGRNISVTACNCSPVPSSKESDDEHYLVDLGSVFIFQPDHERTFIPQKSTSSDLKESESQPIVDQELRRSTTVTLKFDNSGAKMPLTAHGEQASACWKAQKASRLSRTSGDKTPNFSYTTPRTCNPDTVIPNLIKASNSFKPSCKQRQYSYRNNLSFKSSLFEEYGNYVCVHVGNRVLGGMVHSVTRVLEGRVRGGNRGLGGRLHGVTRVPEGRVHGGNRVLAGRVHGGSFMNLAIDYSIGSSSNCVVASASSKPKKS